MTIAHRFNGGETCANENGSPEGTKETNPSHGACRRWIGAELALSKSKTKKAAGLKLRP